MQWKKEEGRLQESDTRSTEAHGKMRDEGTGEESLRNTVNTIVKINGK